MVAPILRRQARARLPLATLLALDLSGAPPALTSASAPAAWATIIAASCDVTTSSVALCLIAASLAPPTAISAISAISPAPFVEAFLVLLPPAAPATASRCVSSGSGPGGAHGSCGVFRGGGFGRPG